MDTRKHYLRRLNFAVVVYARVIQIPTYPLVIIATNFSSLVSDIDLGRVYVLSCHQSRWFYYPHTRSMNP